MAILCCKLDMLENNCCTRQAEPRHLTITLTCDIDLWPWPVTLTPGMTSNSDVQKLFFFCIWPWPLTYDVDQHSQPSLGQGQPHMPKIKVMGQTVQQGEHTQTNRRMDVTMHIISLLCYTLIKIQVGSLECIMGILSLLNSKLCESNPPHKYLDYNSPSSS